MTTHLDFNTYKKQVFKNPQIKAEYDRLQPEFSLISALIKARKTKGYTQAQLAQKIGTKQSAISRLEGGQFNPTFSLLNKIAKALDSKIHICFR